MQYSVIFYLFPTCLYIIFRFKPSFSLKTKKTNTNLFNILKVTRAISCFQVAVIWPG